MESSFFVGLKKIFWSQNFLEPKFFYPKKFLTKIIFCPQKCVGKNMFGSVKILCQKYFESEICQQLKVKDNCPKDKI